ncbi:hypothetical protein SUGI_0016720 [Cryptomeria japonica]|nr:hypothetical protein SUGI_0016720 [Cryptomeria japonica]
MGPEENQNPIVIFDSWMWEAGEASKLADEIDCMMAMAAGADTSYHVLTEARRKLMVVGTQLDRLESLVHNPPSKPIL